MYNLKCGDCGREVETENEDWQYMTCKECNGAFSEIEDEDDSEDDTLSDFICLVCGKEKEAASLIIWDSGYFYNNSNLDTLTICKSCIDKDYPRESKVEYKEKIIEKPIYTNSSDKKNSDGLFGKVF